MGLGTFSKLSLVALPLAFELDFYGRGGFAPVLW
jgi:hypothetical protein